MDVKGEAAAGATDQERRERIEKRINRKVKDYEGYSFSRNQVRMLNIFFDLTQEFRGRENFYQISVLLPKLLFDLDCSLYYLEDKRLFTLGASTLVDAEIALPMLGKPSTSPVERNGNLLVPIKCNPAFTDMLPFEAEADVIGFLEIRPATNMSMHDRLFLEKYANRIGYQLHNRIIRTRNREHLDFIQNLVEDIGHNVIVPNMYFRLFFNRLRGKIEGLEELREEMVQCPVRTEDDNPCSYYRSKLEYLYEGITNQFNEIFSHYKQTSMFLETLLRRRHFEEGRYVVEKRKCRLRSQVIEPQEDRYRSRLEERDVELDRHGEAVGEGDLVVEADVGLLSQVFANFFSNAVKYTRDDPEDGDRRTSWGWVRLPDYFGDQKDGLRIEVFTTGPCLSDEDRDQLFTSGFRGENVEREYGTGHGLYFVRQVVELHDGIVGYETRPGGNLFYFILPLDKNETS